MRKVEKVVVVSGSRGLQKTELQDLQLGTVIGVVAGNKACIAGYSAAVWAYMGGVGREAEGRWGGEREKRGEKKRGKGSVRKPR